MSARLMRGALSVKGHELTDKSARADENASARLNVIKFGNNNIYDNLQHKNALKTHKNSVI